MSRKKSKRKVDIRSSILVLLLIAILLIASTYAWFTANTKVTIDTLEVNVKAQNGLQISADGTTWKTVLQNTDIDPDNVSTKYSGNTNQIPTVMEPVSTVGNIVAGKMDMFYGVVTSDDAGVWKLSASKLTDTKGKGENAGKYIVFDTFLKVDKESPLTLTAESNVVAKDPANSKGLENAARVAFVELGNTGADSTIATIQGLGNDKGTGDAGVVTHIWEPNYDVHTSFGATAARDTYGITTTEGPDAAKIPYNGIKAEISADNAVTLDSTDENYFSAVTPEYTTKKAITDTQIFTLKAGVTKVRIYMWVEGQDVDCENTASGSDIQYNVQFTIPGN